MINKGRKNCNFETITRTMSRNKKLQYVLEMNFPAEVAGLMDANSFRNLHNSTNRWITSQLASRVAHYASTHKLALTR